MFFQLWQKDPISTAYNSGFVSVLSGALDLGALQMAALLVYERQQSLRTRFLMRGSEAVQTILPLDKVEALRVRNIAAGFGNLQLTADGGCSVAPGVCSSNRILVQLLSRLTDSLYLQVWH
jgi:hypothetical protein